MVWIGLNDLDEEGNYVWQDGSSSGYTNWQPGKPIDNPDASCVALEGCHSGETSTCKTGGWANLGCIVELYYTCSMSATT